MASEHFITSNVELLLGLEMGSCNEQANLKEPYGREPNLDVCLFDKGQPSKFCVLKHYCQPFLKSLVLGKHTVIE